MSSYLGILRKFRIPFHNSQFIFEPLGLLIQFNGYPPRFNTQSAKFTFHPDWWVWWTMIKKPCLLRK
ncbi:MAG: hypothetical protein ACK5JC_10035, partial [Bacteroidota bacterium]